MISAGNLLKIGAVIKPHGVAGELVIRLSRGLNQDDFDPGFIFVELQGGLVPFEVCQTRGKSGSDIIVSLDRVKNERDAKELKGCDVYVQPGGMEENFDNGEFDINILAGYRVIDINHGSLGHVEAVIDIQDNPLLKLSKDGREILVPLNNDFIVTLDPRGKLLEIKTPEGLIELFLE